MTTAERASVVISIVAVAISLLSTYIQFFWRHNELRLDWSAGERGWPSMEVTPAHSGANDGKLRIVMSPSMVFVNTGNRPVAVAEVRLELLYNEAQTTNIWSQGRTPPFSACYDKNHGGAIAGWETFTIDGQETQAHSITILPGEIKSVLVSFRPIEELIDSTWRSNSEVTTCFLLQLIDSSGRRIDKRISAFKFGESGGTAEERSGPINLL